ncbi:conserved hypothetical protein [Culex quinquefasciatus]|uniref:Uncharacterized protein n=1 Tax=Culex quinquefasciatus TaxID=7176 RepID=B0WY07_CULQU|nr:conserved hypothetical protein [Culex quinquefasciatus]|eukprot:XP_001862279.1 conserved hypothetical protein [Culex quinquefasciatus]
MTGKATHSEKSNQTRESPDQCAVVTEVSVRSNLSSWLQRLCVSCLDREQTVNSDFGRSVLEKVLNITVRYLTDEPGVRCGAFETLTYLIEKGFLDKATTEETVCPVVEKLCRKPLDTFDEELYAIFIHKRGERKKRRDTPIIIIIIFDNVFSVVNKSVVG